MSYDQKCYDLAAAFLEDSPGATEQQRDKLAQRIQSTIEDWLSHDDDAPPSTRSMPILHGRDLDVVIESIKDDLGRKL
jgi:hypothetical protein